jgi:hypothetical protein
MAIKVYNKLPVDIKSCQTFTLFSKRIKQYLINKCLYNINEYFET